MEKNNWNEKQLNELLYRSNDKPTNLRKKKGKQIPKIIQANTPSLRNSPAALEHFSKYKLSHFNKYKSFEHLHIFEKHLSNFNHFRMKILLLLEQARTNVCVHTSTLELPSYTIVRALLPTSSHYKHSVEYNFQ